MEYFGGKNGIFLEAFISDVYLYESNCWGVDPTQKYGENTKSPTQDSIDFAIKPYKFLIIICYFQILLSDLIIS